MKIISRFCRAVAVYAGIAALRAATTGLTLAGIAPAAFGQPYSPLETPEIRFCVKRPPTPTDVGLECTSGSTGLNMVPTQHSELAKALATIKAPSSPEDVAKVIGIAPARVGRVLQTSHRGQMVSSQQFLWALNGKEQTRWPSISSRDQILFTYVNGLLESSLLIVNDAWILKVTYSCVWNCWPTK